MTIVNESDIEDLEVDVSTRQPANVNIINSNNYKVPTHKEHDFNDSQHPYLPGAQKVWLKTFGCSHNVFLFTVPLSSNA